MQVPVVLYLPTPYAWNRRSHDFFKVFEYSPTPLAQVIWHSCSEHSLRTLFAVVSHSPDFYTNSVTAAITAAWYSSNSVLYPPVRHPAGTAPPVTRIGAGGRYGAL